MIRHTFNFSTLFIAIFLTINLVLALITNVSTDVTSADKAVFRSIFHLEKPKGKLKFEEEIALISSIQMAILQAVPVGPGIPEYQNREPADLVKNKSGLCYDRSRTYDKVFTWLGFEARHVYILYPEHPVTGEKLPFWKAFITVGTATHAVTEVKTSRGWLLVDSNSPWISLTSDGIPIDADHIFEKSSQFTSLPAYFNRPFWAIRGLYSRRGQFYRPNLLYPDLNWEDFVLWVIDDPIGISHSLLKRI